MNKNRDLIITGATLFIAAVMPGFFQAGIWGFGSVAFLILPGYWILKLFTGIKPEDHIARFALAFPVSIAYLSVASYLVSRAGIDIGYLSVMVLAGLPCLLWLSGMGRKLC